MIGNIDHWAISPTIPNAYDQEELSTLTLVAKTVTKLNELIKAFNNLDDSNGEFKKLITENFNALNKTVRDMLMARVTIRDLEDNRKLDWKGNFTGTWFGVKRPEELLNDELLNGIVNAHADYIEQVKRGFETAESLGIMPDTDVTYPLQQALNAGKRIIFQHKRNYIISDTITLDAFISEIDGNGCIFTMKNESDYDKVMFKITSSGCSKDNGYYLKSETANPYFHSSFSPLHNVTLQPYINESKGETVQEFKRKYTAIAFEGLYHREDVETGVGRNLKVSNFTFNNLAIYGFKKGIDFTSDCLYCINFAYSSVSNCDYCIYGNGTLKDNGERLVFMCCTIGANNTSGYAIYINSTMNLHFIACSIDYTYTFCYLNLGRIFCHNCHIETGDTQLYDENDTSHYWININATGMLLFDGCRVILGSSKCKAEFIVKMSEGSNYTPFFIMVNCSYAIYTPYVCSGGQVRFNNNHHFNTKIIRSIPSKQFNYYYDGECKDTNATIFTRHNKTVRGESNPNPEYDETINQPVVNAEDGGYTFTHNKCGYESWSYVKLCSNQILNQFKVRIKMTIDAIPYDTTEKGDENGNHTFSLVDQIEYGWLMEILEDDTGNKDFVTLASTNLTLLKGTNEYELTFIQDNKIKWSNKMYKNIWVKFRPRRFIEDGTRYRIDEIRLVPTEV